ncbi:MAG: hypothetical protein ABJP83_00900, partial [Roseibium sp.]
MPDKKDRHPPKPLWPFKLFAKSHWMTGRIRPPQTECWTCRGDIKINQKYCKECKHWQTWRRHFNFSNTDPPPLKWSIVMFRKTEDGLLPFFGSPGWNFPGVKAQGGEAASEPFI